MCEYVASNEELVKLSDCDKEVFCFWITFLQIVMIIGMTTARKKYILQHKVFTSCAETREVG